MPSAESDAGLPEPLPWQRPFVEAVRKGERIVLRPARRVYWTTEPRVVPPKESDV